jgi:hypothetical protein
MLDGAESLDEDGGNYEDLRTEGDEPGRRGFQVTHFSTLVSREQISS